MSTHPIYDQLIEELSGEKLSAIERKVFEALKRNPDGLRREQLIAIVFGESVGAGTILNNNTKDRMVRRAIQSLRSRLVPILSSSGQAGYRLDVGREARQAMINELLSRRARLDELIQRAAKMYEMPAEYVPAEKAEQMVLV